MRYELGETLIENFCGNKSKQNSNPNQNHQQQQLNKNPQHQKSLTTHFGTGLQVLCWERSLPHLQRKETHAETVLEIQTGDSPQLPIFEL